MQFFLNQSQNFLGLTKSYFWGHPVIQAVKAKMIGPFYKKNIFTKYFGPEKFSHSYPLRAEFWVLSFGKEPRSLRYKESHVNGKKVPSYGIFRNHYFFTQMTQKTSADFQLSEVKSRILYSKSISIPLCFYIQGNSRKEFGRLSCFYTIYALSIYPSPSFHEFPCMQLSDGHQL